MIIVTGGAGFIGSCLISHLNAEGIRDIIVVDEIKNTHRWKNLLSKRFRDFLHKDEFLKLIESGKPPREVEAIVHLGACSSTTETDCDFLHYNNFRYSKVLAEYAINNEIRFIYASSAATYGAGESGYSDNDESTRLLRPLNPYGYSKQLFDMWVLENDLEEDICGLKFFNVYGPNEYHKESMRSMVLKSFEQISEKASVRLFKSHNPDYSDGEQKRDFIYVKDCTSILLKLISTSNINGIFNLGSGMARSWNDLANAVFKAAGKTPNIEYFDMPTELQNQYQYFTEADMTKLHAALGDFEVSSLEDGVQDYVSEHLKKQNPYY